MHEMYRLREKFHRSGRLIRWSCTCCIERTPLPLLTLGIHGKKDRKAHYTICRIFGPSGVRIACKSVCPMGELGTGRCPFLEKSGRSHDERGCCPFAVLSFLEIKNSWPTIFAISTLIFEYSKPPSLMFRIAWRSSFAGFPRSVFWNRVATLD